LSVEERAEGLKIRLTRRQPDPASGTRARSARKRKSPEEEEAYDPALDGQQEGKDGTDSGGDGKESTSPANKRRDRRPGRTRKQTARDARQEKAAATAQFKARLAERAETWHNRRTQKEIDLTCPLTDEQIEKLEGFGPKEDTGGDEEGEEEPRCKFGCCTIQWAVSSFFVCSVFSPILSLHSISGTRRNGRVTTSRWRSTWSRPCGTCSSP